eukprot:m.191851 g.191851  ORF g.191851 m.191851 type:complete len:367 (+) comp10052_c2_seq2:808-1908(+)
MPEMQHLVRRQGRAVVGPRQVCILADQAGLAAALEAELAQQIVWVRLGQDVRHRNGAIHVAGRRRGAGGIGPVPMALHLPGLDLLSQHDDGVRLGVPDHAPKGRERCWDRALRGDVAARAAVAGNIIGVDVVAVGVVVDDRQHNPRVVVRHDVLIPILEPVLGLLADIAGVLHADCVERLVRHCELGEAVVVNALGQQRLDRLERISQELDVGYGVGGAHCAQLVVVLVLDDDQLDGRARGPAGREVGCVPRRALGRGAQQRAAGCGAAAAGRRADRAGAREAVLGCRRGQAAAAPGIRLGIVEGPDVNPVIGALVFADAGERGRGLDDEERDVGRARGAAGHKLVRGEVLVDGLERLDRGSDDVT